MISPRAVLPEQIAHLRHEAELLKIQQGRLQRYMEEKHAHTSFAAKMRFAWRLMRDQLIYGNARQRRHFVLRFIAWSPRLWQKLRNQITSAIRNIYVLLLPADRRYFAQRHHRWLAVIGALSNHETLTQWAQQSELAPLRILIFGAGGIGDVLRITPILHALKMRVPTAQICLLHTNPHVGDILRGNPDVATVASAPWWLFDELEQAALAESAADLVVHFRYTVFYHPSLRLMEQEARYFGAGFFEAAATAHAPWNQYMHRYPHHINMLCRHANQLNLSMFALMGLTANLPITTGSDLHFAIDDQDRTVIADLKPPSNYITVHNGAQASMMIHAEGGRITKMLATETWNAIAQRLAALGYHLVQLGEAGEALINAIGTDLRGKLTLHQTAAVLEGARCHIDTEGGLVHLARAMKTRSIVLFGPTSAAFFGYPQNINLGSVLCSNCYWIKEDWYAHCPRGLAAPACMDEHKPETVVAAVQALLADEHVLTARAMP